MKFNVGDIIKVKNRVHFNNKVKNGFIGEIVKLNHISTFDVIVIDFFDKDIHDQVLTTYFFDDISLVCSAKERTRRL